MAIAKKNRRTINYNGNNFLWWIADEFDEAGNMLSVNIASSEKKFLIKYFAVPRNPDENYLFVLGDYFPGLKKKQGNSMKLRCPDFSGSLVTNAVKPKMITAILDWCFDADRHLEPIQ